MRSSVLGAACLLSLACLSNSLRGQCQRPPPPGGTWRGPADITPPPDDGRGAPRPPTIGDRSGPTTGDPSGPSAGNPAPTTGSGGSPGPTTGVPLGPVASRPAAAGSAGPRTGVGIVLTPDLSRWEYWWSVNKDRFLRLREAVHATRATTYSDQFFMGAGRVSVHATLRPRERDVNERVLPALVRLLEDGDGQRDVTRASMFALAKFGEDHDAIHILPLFRERLRSRDQGVREAAALAIGLSGRHDGVDDLVELVRDTTSGRRACRRGSVDDRTRAFAAHGLGLIGRATERVDVKRTVFEALREVLEHGSVVSRDVRIAAISSLGLLRPGADSAKSARLLDRILAFLGRYGSRRVGVGAQWVQSHVPTAIARLLRDRPDDLRHGYYKKWLLRRVTDADANGRSNQSLQSAILALGELASEYEDETSADRAISEALLDVYRRGRDKQAGYFALVALGQIGGERNRAALIGAFRKGSKALQKPWAALALGLHCRGRMTIAGDCPDPLVGQLLLRQMREVKNGSTRGAIAIAIGLSGYRLAAEDLRETLVDERHREDLAGHLCTGLALLRDQRSIKTLRDIVHSSLRRPAVLRDAAVALGMLGDKTVADLLLEVLGDSTTQVARLAPVSLGLGMLGDRRTIDPLLELAQRRATTDLGRAFAIAALGGVIEKGRLPWNEPIAANLNYRANVPTLIDFYSGVLDIL